MNKIFSTKTPNGRVYILAPNTSAALKIKKRIETKIKSSALDLHEEIELTRTLRAKGA